ncbi:hypothetical protein [Thiomonas sp. X19]|uniref:hypothetical protein n=1 Tax=Thiomonas sp. X19 TaxID=1050370 RepID=UPI0013147B00|nr:hypothetical protein [Thiomonas sp. X19]
MFLLQNIYSALGTVLSLTLILLSSWVVIDTTRGWQRIKSVAAVHEKSGDA